MNYETIAPAVPTATTGPTGACWLACGATCISTYLSQPAAELC